MSTITENTKTRNKGGANTAGALAISPQNYDLKNRPTSGLEAFIPEKPLGVVRPRTIPELQYLIRDAAKKNVRLQVISSAGPHVHGDIGCCADSMILDMSLFNEIVRVNRRNKVLFFETGVDFTTLTRAAHLQSLRPFLPLCPKPGKSALTSYLEREPNIYPSFNWDISDPLLCLEVVLGNGDLFRTGAAAGPGTLRQQWQAGDAQKFPMGPGASDIMKILQGAQGSFGAVTWCTAKAEVKPVQETLYIIGSAKPDPLIEICYQLLYRKHPDICFIMNANGLNAVLHRDASSVKKNAGEFHPWNLVFSISAPQIAPKLKLKYVNAEIRKLLDKHALQDQFKSSAQNQKVLSVLTDPGHKLNQSWYKLAGQISFQEIFFQTTLDRSVHFIQQSGSQASLPGDPLIYIQPQLGGRNCHLEFTWPYSQKPTISQTGYKKMIRDFKKAGAYFSRPYPVFGSDIYENESSLEIMKRLPDIFDPDRVFSPNGLMIYRSKTATAKGARK